MEVFHVAFGNHWKHWEFMYVFVLKTMGIQIPFEWNCEDSICINGIKEENISAPNPIFEKTSNKIGYPTSSITFKLISSM